MGNSFAVVRPGGCLAFTLTSPWFHGGPTFKLMVESTPHPRETLHTLCQIRPLLGLPSPSLYLVPPGSLFRNHFLHWEVIVLRPDVSHFSERDSSAVIMSPSTPPFWLSTVLLATSPFHQFKFQYELGSAILPSAFLFTVSVNYLLVSFLVLFQFLNSF